MRSINKNWIIGLVIVILVAGAWLIIKKPQQSTGQNIAFTIDKAAADLGRMSVNEEKTAEFQIKNTGASALMLTNFETSCDCTFAKIITSSSESPTFNMRMHTPQAFLWKTSLQPNEEAKIQIIYKPSVMPVYGWVERYLTFKTSNPDQSEVKLKITAFVE